ncbi:MAG: SUMF1/EgtB/PvdO family nonheme iron enzyme, partial [Roseiflexaceae bacterium]|nr:SUMF1/EgtB/PvdO family nonheme iron enzyme [Roseiflexaceae bacterium]
MSVPSDADERQRKIAELEAQIAALKTQAAPQIDSPTATRDVNIATNQTVDNRSFGTLQLRDDATINGVAVGINLGRIVYGRDPQEDERRRIAWYLANLANKLVQLPLQGIDQRPDQSNQITLPQVYTMLSVERECDLITGTLTQIQPYFTEDAVAQRPWAQWTQAHLRPEYSFDWVLPATAISKWAITEGRIARQQQIQGQADIALGWFAGATPVDITGSTDQPVAFVARRLLATEALLERKQLVLLGDPGSGKSTFVRHLAWGVAQLGLDLPNAQQSLQGWKVGQRLLPVLLPIRQLAGQLAGNHRASAEQHVRTALLNEVAKLCGQGLDDALSEALGRGKALLIFDGLDEVPIDGAPGVATRAITLRAIRNFCRLYPRNLAILTCRTRAFSETLREDLGWPVDQLAAFTLGQIRHFAPAWYTALRGKLQEGQVEQLSQKLIDTIVASPKLRQLAETPLLLTLMALVLLNRGELPRDRPKLYEEVLELLLGQWDAVRDGQRLGDAIGLPDWGSDRFRRLLDKISYDAHLAATSGDGRGRLRRSDVRDELIEFFTTAQVANPGDTALKWLAYIELRSGLLAPDDDKSYVFVHLTLQEHCAGRHMLLHQGAAALVAQYRADDRWREPIMLGLGVAQQSRPELVERILTDLIDPEETGNTTKERVRWQRDLILAAEIGVDRDWNYLRTQDVKVDRIQRDLRRSLAILLNDPIQPLPIAERLRAGTLLGDLGDPRFPVTPEQWQAQWQQHNRSFGQPNGYFCYVPAGTYRIGGWDEGDPSADLSLHEFWITRLPITVAQYRVFMESGGYSTERWWTPEGWRWKGSRDAPWRWDEPQHTQPNQPVSGATWYEAMAYCNWLSEQLASSLPAGYAIRLPTEAEWEAAAAWDRTEQRRIYPWGAADPTTELAIYDELKLAAAAPVGCCPAGSAACGAIELAGNVWEWCTNSYQAYP